jgi:hypothetical protein
VLLWNHVDDLEWTTCPERSRKQYIVI